ncbi:MAG TPA: CHASE domain-containing protein, partial [Geothrix sp.]
MNGNSSHLLLQGRLRILTVITAGIALSLFGFFFSREAHRRQVEAEFAAAALDRAESVIQGIRLGFEDVTILRSFYEASDEVTRADFDSFTSSVLARHPYIQALQWLPDVTPRNRALLEEEARRAHPGFGFFRRDAAGNTVAMEPGASFYAIQFVAPFRGNEVTLGFSAETQATRQEALARALRTGGLAASGRIRLIQEPGDQAGVLVM